MKSQSTADDEFFTQAIQAYLSLADTNARYSQYQTLRELQQRLPASITTDAELTRVFGEALKDQSKLPAVFERAAKLLKEAEDQAKAKKKEAAQKKCGDEDKPKADLCIKDCKGDDAAKCKTACAEESETRVNPCVDKELKK